MNAACPHCHHEFVYENEPEICMGAVKCPRCPAVLTQENIRPWSATVWHGKRIRRSPTFDDQKEAEKWVQTQRRDFHPRHWVRSALLRRGFFHQSNPNQRGKRHVAVKKVVEVLIS